VRRAAFAVFLLAVAGLLLARPTGPASAHALVRSSDPADGALLQRTPSRVLITFTEPPDPGLSSAHVLDSSGKDVEAGPSARVPGHPLELQVPLPSSLPKGVYTVTWRAVSRADGHVTAGSFSFGIGVQPAASGSNGAVSAPSTPSPPPLAVAGRFAFYWGLAILLGGAGAFLAWWRPGHARAAERWLLSAGWVLAAAGLAAMIAAEGSVIGVSVGAFLRSAAGREFVERAVALVVAGVAVLVVLARPGRASAIFLAAASAAAMLVHALAGHAAVSSPAWFNVGVQWVHLLAVGVWIGGLPWLLAALSSPEADRGALARRYSAIAGVSLLIVALTGVSRMLDELGWPAHWARFVRTSFGVTLLVKIVVVGVLVLLGARNRYRNVPRASDPSARSPFQRTVVAELVVASVALAATGLLSELAPAATVAQATRRSQPTSVSVTGSDFGTTVRVRLTATPGEVGPNRFDLTVRDFDTGRTVAASAVALDFSLPGRPDLGTQRLDLTRGPGGVWSGQGTVLSMAGRWNVAVTVQGAAGAVQVPLVLQTRLPHEVITTIPGASGQPTLYQIRLAGGGSVQTYLDPGQPGNDVVHFTFFTAAGNELPIASATGTQTGPNGVAASLDLRRFSAGHFVANTQLSSGPWRFQIVATARDGTVYQAYFDQTIR
jgi:copper transport protein